MILTFTKLTNLLGMKNVHPAFNNTADTVVQLSEQEVSLDLRLCNISLGHGYNLLVESIASIPELSEYYFKP